MLCLFFNTMSVYGFTPNDLLKAFIISISKDSTASSTTGDTYTESSLFNFTFTLFDNVILLLFGNELQSSDM